MEWLCKNSNVIEAVSNIVAIIGGLFAVLLAIYQARLHLNQRKKDYRLKQSENGKLILDEIFDFWLSENACNL
jgi:hypothetical protein